MDYAEIVSREDKNDSLIYLYMEGYFYKAYERSAFGCLRQLKVNFKPMKKLIRKINREVVSIGFPERSFPRYFMPEDVVSSTEKEVVLKLHTPIDLAAFETWKREVEIPQVVTPQEESRMPRMNNIPANQALSVILKMIKDFQIESSTPMDCQQFLIQVKRLLNS